MCEVAYMKFVKFRRNQWKTLLEIRKWGYHIFSNINNINIVFFNCLQTDYKSEKWSYLPV